MIYDLSVIIPCYNSSETIKSAIESVFIQDANISIEVIVVDDNSSDINSLENEINNIDSKPGNNIRLIKLSKNNGGGNARNIGISKSNSKYISFLDSDDTWMRGKLNRQIKIYKPGTILTSKVKKGSDLSSAIVLPKEIKLDLEPVSEALFVTNKLIQTSTFFMSSDIAKMVMFNPNLPRHQDYDFLLRAEHLGFSIVQDDEPTSFWRVEDSSSNRFLKKKATPEFFIQWFSEYRKYMTNKAQVSYVSKNIFSACIITRKFKLLCSFVFLGDFDTIEIFKIFYHVVKWRFNKVFR
ncbi:glycosyltransferase family 2 protein [Vibrio parahaemolyticus]|uniref:glycosyltransferase family 2 protein n=1 Tax=Vibrio parahaemolyticus TaxID=670 RepID=UPI0027E598E0|nr:glycosyltransferase family 2 protein [Vibrio parahaemolyticus]WMN63447.1 glycosyltransferase [Vibrio parahaemolyticus]